MRPAVPYDANVVYSKPADWDEEKNGPCDDIHVVKKDGFISSFWLPDEAELAALNAGGFVLLVITSNELPPMAIGVVSASASADSGNQMAASDPQEVKASESENGPGTQTPA